MKYFIDSGDMAEIEEAISLGACGITANPSMYAKSGQAFYPFLKTCSGFDLPFLSGEVMGSSTEEMLKEADAILGINPNIVIKINFSKEGLKLCRLLKQKNAKCALTLIFTLAQAVAAVNAGADFVFPFVGRSDEYGGNGIALTASIQQLIAAKGYPVKVVAASIKNLRQLEELAACKVDYAALSFALLETSLVHPLTEAGARTFGEDWKKVDIY